MADGPRSCLEAVEGAARTLRGAQGRCRGRGPFEFAIAKTALIPPLLRRLHARVTHVDCRRHLAQMHSFCKNAFRGPGTQLVVSAALSRRKGPFRAARGWVLPHAKSGGGWN